MTRRGDAWRVHVYLGRDAQTGKRRYLTRTVRGTKREAETVCAQLVAEAARGEHGETAAGTVADLVAQWMAHIESNVSPSTLASYRIYLDRWILPALGAKKLDRLRPADIDRFYGSMRGEALAGEHPQDAQHPPLLSRAGGQVADDLLQPSGVGDAPSGRQAADHVP